jgi:hypothetical protein
MKKSEFDKEINYNQWLTNGDLKKVKSDKKVKPKGKVIKKMKFKDDE